MGIDAAMGGYKTISHKPVDRHVPLVGPRKSKLLEQVSEPATKITSSQDKPVVSKKSGEEQKTQDGKPVSVQYFSNTVVHHHHNVTYIDCVDKPNSDANQKKPNIFASAMSI